MKHPRYTAVIVILAFVQALRPAAGSEPGSAQKSDDARLLQKVTLHEKGEALSDFCADLQQQTGVELSASRATADEKVTVFVEERPAREVMREVARLFGFFWLRSGHEATYRYELDQDLRSQLAEEELRNQDLDAALIALDAEMQQDRRYLEMSPEELWKRQEQGDERAKRLSQPMQGWKRSGIQLYHRLTPRDRSALIAGQEVVFRPGDADPDHRLSEEFDRQLFSSWGIIVPVGGQGRLIGELPGARVQQMRLKLDRSELGQVSLQAHVSVAWRGEHDGEFPYDNSVLATGRSPSATKPDNATANARLRDQAPFNRVVSFHPQPTCPLVKTALARHAAPEPDSYSVLIGNLPPHVFSSDVWEAVHRATGLPIVADYYTRIYRLDAVTIEHKPLFDALCTVGDSLAARWTKDGNFLLCRSSSYFWDKLKEVPNRYLQRWIHDREANNGLPLSDMLEMASRPDQELDSRLVGEGIEHCWGLMEWYLLGPICDVTRSTRRHGRFPAILTPEQVRRALQPAGLPFKELTLSQQQAAIQINYDDIQASQWRDDSTQPVRADQWPHCVIELDYVPAGWYAWTRPRASYFGPWDGPTRYIGGRTAAEALAAVRRVYPPASAQDVQVQPLGWFWVEFRFEFPDGQVP